MRNFFLVLAAWTIVLISRPGSSAAYEGQGMNPYGGYYYCPQGPYYPQPGGSPDDMGYSHQAGMPANASGQYYPTVVGEPTSPAAIGVPITSNKAMEIAEMFLKKTLNEDLLVQRLFEYNTHFEVELLEKDTRRGAFELIIDKFNGRVTPEIGPNLLWNGKFGQGGNYFGLQPVMTIPVVSALQSVGDFIKRTSPELKVEGDVIEYYGYYEFHVTQDDKMVLEININGFSGQMWIENWHGSLLREAKIAR